MPSDSKNDKMLNFILASLKSKQSLTIKGSKVPFFKLFELDTSCDICYYDEIKNIKIWWIKSKKNSVRDNESQPSTYTY